jgi:hypothetical protein
MSEDPQFVALARDYVVAPGPKAARALSACLIQLALTPPRTRGYYVAPERQQQARHSEYPQAHAEFPQADPEDEAEEVLANPRFRRLVSFLVRRHPVDPDSDASSLDVAGLRRSATRDGLRIVAILGWIPTSEDWAVAEGR